MQNEDGGTDFKNVSSALTSDYFTLNTIEDGETTLTTVDSGGETAHLHINVDGSFDVDAAGDITLDAAGDNIKMLGSGGSGLDFIQSGTGDYTIKNLTSDKDIVFNVNDGGADTEVMRLDGSAGSVLIATGVKLNIGDGGEYITGDGTDLSIVSGNDIIISAADNAQFGCPAGFSMHSETYGDASETTEGGTATDIDFRITNKIFLEATGNILKLNFIFPDIAGNFVFVLKHGVAGGCDIAEYSAYYPDVTHESAVRWPGGTEPTLSNTENEHDVISLFWPGQTLVQAGSIPCLAVASTEFSAP
jgi:hypothetical protein